MFSIILLYAICASTFTLSKATLAYSAPFFYIAVRMTLAGFLLLCYTWFTRNNISTHKKPVQKKISRRTLFLFAQIILFHISIPYILEIWALTRITSTESALLFNLSPFIAAILSYLWFSEKLSKQQIYGLTIGFCSTIPLLLQQNTCSLHHIISGNIIALFAVLIAVISSSYAWILIKDLVQQGYHISLINGIAMFSSGFIALLLSIYLGEWHTGIPVTSWIPFMTLTIAIIIVANIIFYNWYGILLKKHSATLLAFAGLITPIFTGIFGAFFLSECFLWTYSIAIMLISIGMALFIYKK